MINFKTIAMPYLHYILFTVIIIKHNKIFISLNHSKTVITDSNNYMQSMVQQLSAHTYYMGLR